MTGWEVWRSALPWAVGDSPALNPPVGSFWGLREAWLLFAATWPRESDLRVTFPKTFVPVHLGTLASQGLG